jgi:regulator of replication initiation timing
MLIYLFGCVCSLLYILYCVLCAADVFDIRSREVVRKTRAETEEEYREKIRSAERRMLEETDALRAEMALLKRKLEETQREADAAKRKGTLSKADGRLEAQAEVHFFCFVLFYIFFILFSCIFVLSPTPALS